jgi:hypothetical protein
MLAVSELNKIISTKPEITLETIEVSSNIKRTWKAGIRMVPALKIGDDILSGVLLSAAKMRQFIEQHQ